MKATPTSNRGIRFVNAALVVLAGSIIVGAACSSTPPPTTALPESTPPQVDTTTIWMDTVRRGDLQIERRGAGQLRQSEAGELYAQLRIPESQSFDLEVGQPAVIDLRVAEVSARVAELADEIAQGTRMVWLEFTGDVPEQALRGMSIDGRIEVGVVEDTLFVGRPAYGQSNARMGLFKLDDEGRFAIRVPVETGAASVNLIQILDGLEEGDEVILSDMSRWDAFDRLALR